MNVRSYLVLTLLTTIGVSETVTCHYPNLDQSPFIESRR